MEATILDGETLHILRRRKKMKQWELAEMVGLKQATVSCYEGGTRKMTLERQREFLRILAGGTVEAQSGAK